MSSRLLLWTSTLATNREDLSCGIDIIAYDFADDFSLVLSDRLRLDLELAADQEFTAFSRLLNAQNLRLSHGKSEFLTFAKPCKLERKPTKRIYGASLHHVPCMEVLLVSIHK